MTMQPPPGLGYQDDPAVRRAQVVTSLTLAVLVAWALYSAWVHDESYLGASVAWAAAYVAELVTGHRAARRRGEPSPLTARLPALVACALLLALLGWVSHLG